MGKSFGNFLYSQLSEARKALYRPDFMICSYILVVLLEYLMKDIRYHSVTFYIILLKPFGYEYNWFSKNKILSSPATFWKEKLSIKNRKIKRRTSDLPAIM